MFDAPISIPVIVISGFAAFDYFFTLSCIFGCVCVTFMIIIRLFSRS